MQDDEVPAGNVAPIQLSRRSALGGAVGAMISLMVAGVATVRAAAPRSRDPRRALLERLCDLVIPETDTPGGGGAGAPDFVLLAIDHGMNGLDGGSLEVVSQSLLSAAGGDFLDLAPAEQSRLLEVLDARAFAHPGSGSPGPAELAWERLKPAIIAGYYTSQIGASRELVYEPVPGPRRANFVLTADYRSRSNEDFGGTL